MTIKPLHLLAALSMIGCGVAIPLHENSKANILFGSVLTTIGGALFSESALGAQSRRRHVRKGLQDFSHPASSSASSSAVATKKVTTAHSTPPIASQPEPVNASVKPSQPPAHMPDPAPLQEGSSETIVQCPDCDTTQRILLNHHVGVSKIVDCQSCQKRFHVHRHRDGTPYTRAWGSGVPASSENAVQHEYALPCPSCESLMKFYFRSEDILERYCFNCGELVEINSKGDMLFHEHRPLVPSFSTEDAINSKNKIICPDHGDRVKPLIKREDRFFAVCKSGKHLIYWDRE